MSQAVEIGMRENLTVRASRADAAAAAAAARIARSQLQLQLSTSTYLTYGDYTNIFSGSPSVTPMSSLLVPSQGYADQNLTLSIPFFTSGRLENSVRAGADRELAAAQDVNGTLADAALHIKEEYYRALLAAENVKVAQSRVDADAELVKTTQALYTDGKGLESSVRRVEAEMADAERSLAAARNGQAKALLDMKVAMGVRLDSDISLADALAFVPPTGDLSAQLADAARFRPELISARARLSAAGPYNQSRSRFSGPANIRGRNGGRSDVASFRHKGGILCGIGDQPPTARWRTAEGGSCSGASPGGARTCRGSRPRASNRQRNSAGMARCANGGGKLPFCSGRIGCRTVRI